jgi:hypothetical protein
MTAQFQTLSLLNKNGELRNSFMEAWVDMFNYVNARIKAGNMSVMELETAVWIELDHGNGVKRPIYFYDARDRAIVDGWEYPDNA